jgi:hypothetical protein
MNIDDSSRCEIISTSFQQGEDDLKAYLKFRGLLDPNEELEEKRKADAAKGIIHSENDRLKRMIPFTKSKDFEAEVLLAKVEFLGFKIEAGVAQRVMMSWILGGSHLPRTTTQFNDLLRKYRDQTMMQVL